MFFARGLLLSTLVLSAVSSPTQPQRPDRSIADWDQLQSLLDDVDQPAIHSALYSLAPKYQEGVFSKDRTAIEQVHSEDPEVATKLVNLAKRQSSNTTTTTTTPPPTTTSATTSSVAPSTTTTTRTTTTPTSTTTTTSAAASSSSTIVSSTTSAAATSSSSAAAASSSSATPAVTTVIVAPTAPASATAVKSISDAVVYSTYGGGLVTLTSSAAEVSFSRSTRTHFAYTTLPDGTVSTSTDVVVVNAPVTTELSAASGTDSAGAASTSNAPGLQNSASSLEAGVVGQVAAVLVGGVVLAMWAL